MQDSVFREILYNDIRTAGYGISPYSEFLEFSALVGSFVQPQQFSPETLPSQSVVSAGIANPQVPELPPAPPVESVVQELPQFRTAQPPQIQIPPSPPVYTTSVPQIPAMEVPAYNPPSPIPSLPQLQAVTFTEAAESHFTPISPPPVPELPTAQIPSPSPTVAKEPVTSVRAPDLPELPKPSREEFSEVEIEELFKQPPPPVPPLPRWMPKQRSPYRSSTPDDPTGQKAYVQEKGVEQLTMTGIVDAIQEAQQLVVEKRHDYESVVVEMLERTAKDVGNNALRLRTLVAAHQRGVTTLTDTNVPY